MSAPARDDSQREFPRALRVLLVEDSDDDALLILRALRRLGCEIRPTRVETPLDLEAALASGDWDLVISDFRMPALNGLAALEIVRSASARVPFIIVSATIDDATARRAIDGGANACPTKYDLSRLVPAVRELIEV